MQLSLTSTKIVVAAIVGLAVILAVVVVCRTYEPSLAVKPSNMPSGLYFLWRQTLYDPILALPGSEPRTMTETISALRSAEATTLEAYPVEQQRTLAALHPYDFLETLPNLERERRTFIDAPSYWHALRYHAALTWSLLRLEDYARMFSDTIYGFDLDYGISAPAGNTSRLHVAQTFAGAYTRAQEQQTEVSRRLRCLTRDGDECSIRYPESDALPTQGEPIDRERVLGYANALRSYFFSVPSSRARSVVGVSSESLPLIYVRDAACTMNDSSAYFFFWRTSRISDTATFFTTPVDEIYFHRTADRVSLFEDALADAGVSYAYQQMNPYLCFDYSLDAGTVRTAYAVYAALLHDPIATAYPEEERTAVLQELAMYEQAIVSDGDIIDAGAVREYMHAAASLLYKAAASGLSEPDERRLLSLLTMWRAKSAWLETEIGTMEDMSVTNRYVLRIMDIPLHELFFSRSYYSTLLLSGNETLYRAPLTFTEHQTDTLPSGSDLVLYQGTLERSIPLADLAAFMLMEGQKSSRVYTTE